jgi:hypothetical protein
MNPELYFLMRHQNEDGGIGDAEIETDEQNIEVEEEEIEPSETDEGDDESAKDEFAGLDDDKVLKYLKTKKGSKAEKLDQLLNADKALSGTTSKHQQAMTAIKALRTVLGDDYESILAKGMRHVSGEDEDDERGSLDIPEPEHFKSFDDATKKQVGATFDYHFKRSMPGLIKEVVKGVKAFLEDEKAQGTRGEILPDYEENQAAYDGIRKKYGITGNSKEALGLIKEKYEQEVESTLSEGATGVKTQARKLGTPPPKVGQRTKTEIDTNFDDPEARKRRYQETTKRRE